MYGVREKTAPGDILNMSRLRDRYVSGFHYPLITWAVLVCPNHILLALRSRNCRTSAGLDRSQNNIVLRIGPGLGGM